MKHVLIISSLEERYYFEEFVKECDALGISVGVLDPENFITQNHKINLLWDNNTVTGNITVTKLGTESDTSVLFDIEDIKVAWYLRVNRKKSVSEIAEIEERFKWSEMLYCLELLYSVLNCTWINEWQVIDYVTMNKLHQQIMARKAGLVTPNTLVSNKSKQIVSFAIENNDTLLLKTMGCVQLDENDQTVMYAELFDVKELSCSIKSLESCAIFAQEYVPKKYEYRAMVIGSEICSCRIDSQASEKTKIDWRHYDLDNVEHKNVPLPNDVEQKLHKFMGNINLQYGAIDMIETPEGEFVFLEINPSGQWHWISVLADLPIAKSVARMLENAM